MNGYGLEKTSVPKLVVPQVREHESGSASSTWSRCSSGSWTLPPVENCTIRSVCSRRACTVSRRRPGSRVGWWSASRMCTWTRDAPTASQALASATSSSSVVGSCGQSALAVSAPVGATVMRVPAAGTTTLSAIPASCQDGLRGDDDLLGGGHPGGTERGVDGRVALDQGQRDRPELVVPGRRRHEPDLAVLQQHLVAALGQPVAGAV